MSNRFFTFVTNFLSGTLAKSSDVNARFGEVATGFDNVQDELNCAIRGPATEKATNMARLPAAASRASKWVAFDASGNPIATVQFPADIDANNKKLTGLAYPASNTEPVTLGYLTSYSASLAGIPSIVGNAGKFLGTDGVGVQWTSPACPATISTEPGMVSTTDGTGAQPTWVTPQQNLLQDSNGYFAPGGATWTTHASVVFTADEYGAHYTNSGALVTQTFDHKTERVTIGAGVALVGAIDVYTSLVTAGTLVGLFRYLDAGGATLSESATTAIANGAGFKRIKVSGTTPVNTASVQLIVRATSVSVSGAKGLKFRNAKVEVGTQPTPFTNDGFFLFYRYRAQNTWGAGLATVTSTLGDGSTTASNRDWRSASGAQAYDVRMSSAGGTSGTAGKGTLSIEAKAIKSYGSMGYAAETDLGNSGATLSINLQANGSYQKAALNANCAISVDSTLPPLVIGRFRIKLVQDGTGGRTTTWFTGAGKYTINWLGGTAPTVASAIGAVTFIDFYWDGATLWGQWTAWS